LTVVAGQMMDPAFWNAQVQANEIELRAGGLALVSQGFEDLLVALSATQFARIAAVDKGVPYFTGGAWTVQKLIDIVYPVGSIYRSVTSTNPGTTFGAGTWEAFGSGRMLVGVNSGDPTFNAANLTGGAKTHALSVTEMPAHGNSSSGAAHAPSDPTHRHQVGFDLGGSAEDSEFSTDKSADYPGTVPRTTQSKTTGITTGNAGGGTAHNNLMPYHVIYRWRRTA
jgi:microcystin-dependent protein